MFRMTGKGCCVQNDREGGAAFRMTEKRRCVQNDREGGAMFRMTGKGALCSE